VYSESAGSNAGWTARAGACLRDSSAGDVPYVGKLIINADSYTSSMSYNTAHAIILHELAHVLAISADGFSNYKVYDSNT